MLQFRSIFVAILLVLPSLCCNSTSSAGADASSVADAGTVPWPNTAHTVLTKPSGVTGNYLETFGKYTAVALDENGDAGVAWVWADENADGTLDDTNVYFSAWDPVAKVFPTAIQVGTIGAPNGGPQGPIALSYDASEKAWILVHQVAVVHASSRTGLQLAVSKDRGATWTSQLLTDGQDPKTQTQYDSTSWPSVVARGGKVHVAWYQNYAGYFYAEGTVGSDPSAWQRVPAPWLTLEAGVKPGPAGVNTRLGLALDANDQAALAYWTTTANEKDLRLTYWRPGSATSSLIATSQDANATREVYLGFAGTQPRVLFAGLLAPLAGNVSTYWATHSTDGVKWDVPSNLPLETGAAPGLAFFAAVSAKGTGVGTYASNGGNGTDKCGRLKTSTSSDFTAWSTCGPDTTNAYKLKPVATSLSLALDGSDHLSLVFTNLNGANGAPVGVVIWRL